MGRENLQAFGFREIRCVHVRFGSEAIRILSALIPVADRQIVSVGLDRAKWKVSLLNNYLQIGEAWWDENGDLHVRISGHPFRAGEKYTILEMGWAVYLAEERVSDAWLKEHGETLPAAEDRNALPSEHGSLVTSHPVLVALALRACNRRIRRGRKGVVPVKVPTFDAAVEEVRQRPIANTFNQHHAGTVPGLARWQPTKH